MWVPSFLCIYLKGVNRGRQHRNPGAFQSPGILLISGILQKRDHDHGLGPRFCGHQVASEKSGFGGDTCRNVIEYMREGSYYFVNPGRDEVFGKPCYRTVEEVPGSFDLAVICTPQGTVEALLKSSRAKGAGAEAEALKMLRSLKGYKLFAGYRGGKKLDGQAVADLIVRVARMAADEKDRLAELDINPVFVYETGVALADALVLKYD